MSLARPMPANDTMPHRRHDLLDAIRLTRRLLSALERLQESPDAASGREVVDVVNQLREASLFAMADALVAALGGVTEGGAEWGATVAARAIGVPLRTLQNWRARNLLHSTQNRADDD